MGQVIGEFLPLAIFVAISPIPIIGVILMLFTDRARSDSLSFLAGWVTGIVLAMLLLLALASTTELATGAGPSTTAAWVMLILGALLLFAAVREWRGRPAPGSDPELPAWMSKIDRMGPGGALRLALLLSAANPKILLLVAGAAVTIAQADLGTTGTIVAVAVFTVIASSTVMIVTFTYLFLGARIQPALDDTKTWLMAHNTAIMAAVLLVIGAALFGKGLGALTSG
jgi:threonine/homoserine/homoserine lactone efflux protein